MIKSIPIHPKPCEQNFKGSSQGQRSIDSAKCPAVLPQYLSVTQDIVIAIAKEGKMIAQKVQ